MSVADAVPFYGPAIQQAGACGDLDEMSKVAAQAEEYLAEHGDVASAIEDLEAAIARAESS